MKMTLIGPRHHKKRLISTLWRLKRRPCTCTRMSASCPVAFDLAKPKKNNNNMMLKISLQGQVCAATLSIIILIFRVNLYLSLDPRSLSRKRKSPFELSFWRKRGNWNPMKIFSLDPKYFTRKRKSPFELTFFFFFFLSGEEIEIQWKEGERVEFHANPKQPLNQASPK